MELLGVFRIATHYGLHFIVPGLIARIYYRKKWKLSWLILTSTMLVDLDHLLAVPMFDSDRLSIGFHFLHSYWAIGIYFIFLFVKKLRIIGIGLLLHMMTDFQDYLWVVLKRSFIQ